MKRPSTARRLSSTSCVDMSFQERHRLMFLAIFVFPSCELHSVSFGQFQRILTEMIFILALWRKARSRTLSSAFIVFLSFFLSFFSF